MTSNSGAHQASTTLSDPCLSGTDLASSPSALPALDPTPAVPADAPPDPPPSADALPPEQPDPPEELYIPGLTSPTLFERLPPWTGCQALVERYLPAHVSEPAPLTGSPQQFALIKDSHSWRALADFAREAIVRSEPSDTQAIFELWTYRLESLAHLRLARLLSRELSRLLHTIGQTFALVGLLVDPSATSLKPLPDVVPFAILLLRARLPVLLRPTSQRAFLKTADALHELRDACRRMAVYYHTHASPRMKERWVSRARDVSATLAGLFAGNESAGARPEEEALPGRQAERDATLATELLAPSKAVPLWLEHGDVARADALLAQMLPQPALEALRLVATSDWDGAADAWRAALEHAESGSARVVLTNNLAIVLLYSGKLRQALATLGPLVTCYDKEHEKDSPGPDVWEAVVFNLATLVELSTADSDTAKVSILRKFVDDHTGVNEGGKINGLDGIRVEAFKLPVTFS